MLTPHVTEVTRAGVARSSVRPILSDGGTIRTRAVAVRSERVM
jgi:hypothetical protein